MPQNNVYLSFGRHGRYGNDTAIDRTSMLEAYLLGVYLKNNYPLCETIYYSPIARAVETAKFRALGIGCNHKIETDNLTENSPKFVIQKFINQVLLNTDNNIRHYHFVTHLPVIEKIGLPCLGAGEICLCEAQNWEQMLSENYSVKIITNPSFQKIERLLHEMNFTIESIQMLMPDEIYNKLYEMGK